MRMQYKRALHHKRSSKILQIFSKTDIYFSHDQTRLKYHKVLQFRTPETTQSCLIGASELTTGKGTCPFHTLALSCKFLTNKTNKENSS